MQLPANRMSHDPLSSKAKNIVNLDRMMRETLHLLVCCNDTKELVKEEKQQKGAEHFINVVIYIFTDVTDEIETYHDRKCKSFRRFHRSWYFI